MWNERAELDIYRSHVTGTTPYRRHYFDRLANANQHFSCIFCQTPLEVHQAMSNQTPTMMDLAGNTNTTPIPTTPMKVQNRGSQQTITSRSSASSSSAYPTPNSDMLMVCAKCRQVLPRCSICMMSLTTYIEDASYAYDPLIAPSPQPALTNCTWFKENSCCHDNEVRLVFSQVRPLIGSSSARTRFLNVLMCYISYLTPAELTKKSRSCPSLQHIFYRSEYLHVCLSYCDRMYKACATALMADTPVGELYANEREFCLLRRFEMNDIYNSSSCFSDDDLKIPIKQINIGDNNKYLNKKINLFLTNNNHDNDTFVHRILQCSIQRYRIGLASFDWNYFDEHRRLVFLSGKEYADYVIPSKSNIVSIGFI
ncbi:unnamed protein product [Rotaria magnacalcarata]|uniref:Folate receptor-like domain-containing protein n=1 Tax=Rotaria magnacalcarata TaxID=392030 RepID=A0A816SAJ8_9BILA|nr:unnamed protein product [Rotaria magnacalcarata]